jgi:hypothetical protein
MIHVRFAPDGTVREIGDQPAGLNPQQWFDRLSRSDSGGYQALAGGRGVFRLSRSFIDELRSQEV